MSTEKLEAQIIQVVYDAIDDPQGGGHTNKLFIQPEKLALNILKVVNVNSYTTKVREFHDYFKQYSTDHITYPPQEVIKLRLALLFEELYELAVASGMEAVAHLNEIAARKVSIRLEDHPYPTNEHDAKVAILDAHVDIEYVLHGSINAYGLGNIFDIAFEEVHSSNMSKACSTELEARETQKAYEDVSSYLEERDGKFFVYRNPDRKLLKSVKYRAADLGTIVLHDELQARNKPNN